jgi:hypothetical protein
MGMSRVWEILKKFKELCEVHGWKTSESEDWVETEESYHNFLCAGEIHPSSFKRITLNGKCIVREGLSYKVVDASYTAWLLSKKLSQDLARTILQNPDFKTRTAIYDFSPLLKGKDACLKLNKTNSPVFHEFENFLENELKVGLKPLQTDKKESDADRRTISETA